MYLYIVYIVVETNWMLIMEALNLTKINAGNKLNTGNKLNKTAMNSNQAALLLLCKIKILIGLKILYKERSLV